MCLCFAPTLGGTHPGKAQRTSPTPSGNAEAVEDQNKAPAGRVHKLGDILTREEQLRS